MKYPKRSQYKHAKQKKYHVRNWAEYNEGLRRRGDLTVWFDEEAIANWMADKTGNPGGQRVYSDMAIETGLVVRMVYKLAYRQTEGFLHSSASLLGLGIEIPDEYTRGPAGNKEVGCGTLSFYDEEGERLSTIRMARMPEVKKASLKVTLSKEVNSCLAERPDLKVVKVADGAKDNWTYLSGELPEGEEVIDFYHAAGHLDTALAAAYGDTHPKRSAQFEKQRHVLLEDDKGVEKVIRSLVHLRDTYPRRKKIAREPKYFRRNRCRMRYAALKKQSLPIGSGVTEAACKTLATQRMKRSGMRWGEQGGQAILSFRALVKSNRFERAWTMLAHTYKAKVTTLDNVVPIRSWQ